MAILLSYRRTDDAAAHSARITAVVRELAADRTNYIIPRSLIAFVHHIVAILGADWDKHHVLDIQCLLHLLVVYIFTEINQVHLVDSHQDMWYAEQR